MIRLFSQVTSCTISIHVNTFDEYAACCVETVTITSENAKEISDKIKTIHPESCTNIEKALKYSNKHIDAYRTKYPRHEVTHIFLTDGVPTVGSIETSHLKTLVSEEYNSIFIGYGSDHDAYLMSEMANNKRGSYFFIDALEKASFVYGEIIHNLLNTIIEEVTLYCNRCEIYNYITNQWTKELYLGSLAKGNEKIYQVRSHDPMNSSFLLSSEKDILFHYPYFPTESFTDCTRYAFRQRTQELLYQAKNMALETDIPLFRIHTHSQFRFQNYPCEPKVAKLKEEIHSFLNILMDYIKAHELEEDKFLKMLCDDLYISYNTIGTNRAGIYTCARQTSQGRQTTYNVSLTGNHDMDQDEDEDDDNHGINTSINNYMLSDNLDSPYATQDILDTMRAVSSIEEYEDDGFRLRLDRP